MTAARNIPETPEQLTANWLTEALRSSQVLQQQQVTAVTSEVLGEGVGFLGDILRLHLEYDVPGKGPRTAIAKLPKLANRWMGELLGAYERENMFYLEFGESLPVRVPTMFYGDFDRDKGSENQQPMLRQADRLPGFLHGPITKLATRIAAGKKRRYILIIEDLQNMEVPDQLQGATTEQCHAVMRSCATLHAHYWESSKLSDSFWLLPLDIDARMRHHMMRKAAPNFAKLFERQMTAGLAQHAARAQDHGLEDLRALCSAPNTLLHCDLRLDNLFFDHGDPVIFDWQLTRQGPGAYDVAYFLSSALADTQQSAAPFLDTYHETLLAQGITGYTRADFDRDYGYATRAVLSNLSTVDQVDVGDGRGSELLQIWIQRLHGRLSQLPLAPKTGTQP